MTTPVLDREHIKAGRTFQQAVEAGNLYQLTHRESGTYLTWQ